MINWFHLPTFITGICTGCTGCLAYPSSHLPDSARYHHHPPDKHITSKHSSDESSQFLAEHGNQRVAEILLLHFLSEHKIHDPVFKLRNAQKRAKQDAFFVRPDIAFVIGEFRRESQFDLITGCQQTGWSVFFSSPQIVFIFTP